MKINLNKRKIIEEELQKGTEITKISAMTNLTRSALYTEFKRSGMTRENYNAEKAQELSEQRRYD